MDFQIITGKPGDTWTNSTGKILWQFHCNFSNSCGRCIQFAGQIGPWWPLPLHRMCNCTNFPIPPGSHSSPFVDFVQEVKALDPVQQARVMGSSNWKLVQSGKVAWEDVVKPNRVLSLQEVVATQKLSVKQMVKAGVSKYHAEQAYQVMTPIAEADLARKKLLEILESQGLTIDQIKGKVVPRLTARVGIAGGPSGPSVGGGYPMPKIPRLPLVKVEKKPTKSLLRAEAEAKAQRIRLEQKEANAKHRAEMMAITEAKQRLETEQAEIRAADESRLKTEGKTATVFPVQEHGSVSDGAKLREIVDRLPESVKRALMNHGITINHATDMETFAPEFAKEKPRGWDEGTTWQNAGGFYHSERKQVLVTDTKIDQYSGQTKAVDLRRKMGVLRHEIGHAFDDASGRVSTTPQFRESYHADVLEIPEKLRSAFTYFLQGGGAGPSEAFAETFAQLQGNGASDLPLMQYFPRVTEYIRMKQSQ